MTEFFVAPIVEGHGEVQAVPALLHRLKEHFAPNCLLRVNPPLRISAGKFLNNDQEFERHILLAAGKASQHPAGLVLIMLDCEDGCPANKGPAILQRASRVRSDGKYFVALAHREYETWFLAAAESLRGKYGFSTDAEPPADPQAIRGAKEWLGRQMQDGYDEITHQLLFSREFSLDQAATIPSFARISRFMNRWLNSLPVVAADRTVSRSRKKRNR